jgi:NADPH:quinone reductase-like Zn-dependent oxidoreductase
MKPEKMKAVLLTGFGGYDKLEYRVDVPVPKPAFGEVLIRVGACGVNNTDIWTREGAYGDDDQSGWQGGSLDFPRIQGADIVGRIVGVGEGGSESRLGKRVMVNPTLYGRVGAGLFDATYIGSERDGGFAEFASVPEENTHEIDSALSDEELATFMLSYLTGEHMLNRAGVQRDETVLITGASGGVGSALVQLAKIRGACVIAVIGKGKEQYLRGLDVDAIVIRGEKDFSGTVQKQLGVSAVDVVADVVAGDQVSNLIDVLRIGGRYVTAGAIAGPKVIVDWRKIYLKHLTIFGSTLGTQQEAKDIVDYVAAGKLKPLLAGTYSLEQIVQAQKDFKKKDFFGKLVIVP